MAFEKIDAALLEEIANIHARPTGAFNIRKDGELLERHSSANIEIVTMSGNPGIEIHIKPGTKGETVHIPVIITKSGVTDVVYNDFHIGEDCDVTIVAGCGIHNAGDQKSQHDGIHSFFLGRNSKVYYVEKHYGEGEGTGARVLNPTTNVELEEGSSCEMVMEQVKGVTTTIRTTNAKVGPGAKLVVTEKLFTHGDQMAESDLNVELVGEDSTVQVVSRSVAKDRSRQVFSPLVVGDTKCTAHVQCDSIIMDEAVVKSVPAIEARSEDAMLMHEAAIGKIAGDQLIKLETLGLTEEEAEQCILEDFLS